MLVAAASPAETESVRRREWSWGNGRFAESVGERACVGEATLRSQEHTRPNSNLSRRHEMNPSFEETRKEAALGAE
jgi:hypothetical protein